MTSRAKIVIARVVSNDSGTQNVVGGTGHYLNLEADLSGGVLELLRATDRSCREPELTQFDLPGRWMSPG